MRAPSARFGEAQLLLGLDRYAEAEAVMDSLITEHEADGDSALWNEMSRMLGYIRVLEKAHLEERDAYMLDSLEVAELDSMIVDAYDRPAAWISSLLCAVYGHCRPPMTGSGGEPQMRLIALPPAPALERAARLAVQPNPASTWVAFSYRLKAPPIDAWLTVTDLTGRSVYRQRLAQREGSVTWAIQSLSAGVYTVGIAEKGKTVLSERLVVQP